ncbi:PREDICTED: WAP four-disulfide core domain protein 8 [Dipodomys ordii]|uniref:WAP four-disulfide core domain protein 8 n=1 Tax=Dipodomys ordii TaxID=10020 RepID=A0A1S3EP66_DIPOR|nr:PREDICTED: WAP four-disulfide core domain protein 8 [Dipodomys ordii]
MLLGLLPRATTVIWKSWGKCSAFSWRNRALLLLFSLSLEQASASQSNKIQQKAGKCPKERFQCRTKIVDLCKTDYNCKAFLKCCPFACGKKCMDPFVGNIIWAEGDVALGAFHFFIHNRPTQNQGKQDKQEFTSALILVKKGHCPIFPHNSRMECPLPCKNDLDCLEKEKCCDSKCGFVCAKIWNVKPGFCPRKPAECNKIDKPKCLQDSDCPLEEKCCSRCGLKCFEPKN